MHINAETLFFALSGGILPPLLWLWFWLGEDRLHPEPRGMIIKAFFFGMLAVPVVLPIEEFVQHAFADTTLIIILWAATEEIFKYVAASTAALHSREFDEPVDALIYLITAALGFSAVENSLFLINILAEKSWVDFVITGNLRFMGATLLHVVSSAAIGCTIAFSFYKKSLRTRELYRLGGVILAVSLHALFNFFIINGAGTNTFIVFCSLWVFAVLLLIFFEKIKRLKPL